MGLVRVLLAAAVLIGTAPAAVHGHEGEIPQHRVVPAAPMPASYAPRLEGNDMVMGNPAAPVTLIEYASLTCPHCAQFALAIFPLLQRDYIATGQVRFVYRDFPLDNYAFMGALIARCFGPERYFDFIEVLYQQQAQWSRGADPRAVAGSLRQLATLGGMSGEQFDACTTNRALADVVLGHRMQGQNEMGVQGTPALFINGQPHRGGYDIETLTRVLRPLTQAGGGCGHRAAAHWLVNARRDSIT